MADAKPVARLVVVGASAGGVEALSTLVATLPPNFPAPIVIAQHLDPRRTSHLREILERRGTLPVRSVETEESLQPGVVYVVPANRHVEITDHHVGVWAGADRSPKPSIDLLLRTAAQVFGERLVAVILTGMGSDGADGAHAVQGAGGTVIIQNPETASYPAMPLSLAPTEVDATADLESIGPLLHDLLTGVYMPSRPDDAEKLRTLLEQLRLQSGIDFSSYKTPTIMRRLQRRLIATRSRGIGDYSRYLQEQPGEYQRLVDSFLIKVTEFFRDPDLFNYLREQIVPGLIATARRQANKELRIWSAGCATGEEAYSLAILIADALGDELPSFSVRVFATDLDGEAIAFARQGVYTRSAVSGLPPALIERYFSETDGVYEVKKSVRSLLIFGQHDLGQRAPFPRTDLVLCRNVLIYFTSELQKRALQLFAFSLREGGALVLGKAETTAPLAEHFVQEDAVLKVYRRHGEPVLLPPARIRDALPVMPLRAAAGPRPLTNHEAALNRAQGEVRRMRLAGERAEGLLQRLPVGVLVVNRRYDIQSINTAARAMLGIHSAAIGEDAIHLSQGIPSTSFRQAIDAAFRGEPAGMVDEVLTAETSTGEQRYLRLICYPEASGGTAEPTVMVVVTDITRAVGDRQALEEAQSRQAAESVRQTAALERLTETNRHLLRANDELTEANAELRSANEEFLVGNEELQAATEEVETLNEELQATNEELETLNEELQATVEELNTTNDDLQSRSIELQELTISLEAQRQASDEGRDRLAAVLASMADAVLVVDHDGRSILTNGAYDALFDGDLQPEGEDGRPLSPEERPRRRAARGESFIMPFTLTGPDGTRRVFEATGRPISVGDGTGGVVVIRDISERTLQRLQEQLMGMASHELRTPLTALRGYLQLLLRALPADLPGTSRRFGEESLRQTDRLAALINDLVDVTRFQSGKLNLTFAPVDLRPLAGQVVEVVRTLDQDRPIELDATEESLVVNADAGRIEQVLLNLLTNALAHAPDTERIDVRLRRADDFASIAVQDYGPGIPERERPNLFSRFYQVTTSNERAGGGLGLGLFIANEIVTAHGGVIEVDSVEGEGATFTVRLPLSGD